MYFVIPESELILRSDKGSGPGGQNRNKRETRARIAWDFESSNSLSIAQKDKIRTFAETKRRLNAAGMLEFIAEDSRSQLQNRRAALARLQTFINQALKPLRKRKRTVVPKSEREARLSEKKRTAKKKEERGKGNKDAL